MRDSRVAQKITRRDWLDFGAQALDSIAMDSCKQAALAPFFHDAFGRKSPAHRKAFCFKCHERSLQALVDAERSCKQIRRNGALAFKATTQDRNQAGFGRPILFFLADELDPILHPAVGPQIDPSARPRSKDLRSECVSR